MIYLTNYQQFAPSKDWLRKADEVTRKLQCMEDDEERTRYINKRARLWSELKERLFELSHGKCWYCEAKEERSDYHVDHFRPKNRIHDDNGVRHDGYWWLAFDWRNYRLACSYCNSPHKGTDGKSRGKSDLFPIKDETWRATGPDCDVDDEMPLLLDPTIQGEPELLWFMEDGKAYPAAETNTYPYKRSEATIELLNLCDARIVEARLALWHRCQALIQRGDRAFSRYCNGSPTGKQEFDHVCKEIRELTCEESKYAATARAYFKSSSLKWVRNLV